MLTKEQCLEALKVDEKVRKCHSHIQLFKKDTLLIYVGKCREMAGGLVATSKEEKWVGKKDIFYRQFGYIVDFILGSDKIHIEPKVGDIAYVDPHHGEFMPVEDDKELLYFKVINLDEINLLIK